MSKITIYGKKSAVALETIHNVEEHYCTNGMFYVKAEGQEFYFTLEAISMIRVETESDEQMLQVFNKSLCDSCITKGCMFQSGIVRNHCDFYKAESEE
jgi:hypothetical protein